MGDSPDTNKELEELLVELVDGDPTPAQRLRLSVLLRDDPAACRRYTKYMILDALLAWELSHVAEDAVDEPVSADPPLADEDATDTAPVGTQLGHAGGGVRPWWKRFRRMPILAAAAAVAAAMVSLLAGWLIGSKKVAGVPPNVALARPIAAGDATRPEPEPTPAAPRNVAVLTRAINPVWGPTSLPTHLGSALTAGRLRLKSGLIQLEFYGGAVVVLEGPADFEIIAADRAFCRQGKLRARAPLKSNRFSIGTPKTDVIDLGTEFGVLVDEKGGSEVQVFEGSVNLKANGPASPGGRQLTTGETVRIGPTGIAQAGQTDPDSFVGTREMQERTSTEAGRRYRAWLDLSRKLRADPRVLVYYSFEGQQPWERTLLDQALGRGPNWNGGIVGCEWTEGRWPGKAALDFKRRSDRVRVEIGGELDALTLMTWVRVDYFDNRLNALLLTDGWEPGDLHWELDGKGILIFAIKNGARCDSPVVLGESQLGLWTHLATVYAPARRLLTHYVNGRAVKSTRIPATGRVVIGSANLGNYTDPPPDVRSDRVIRNLNGRIDEFVIFDQVLDAEEIQAIYDVGKPAS